MRTRPVLRFAAALTATGGATLAYAALIERNLFTLRRYDVPVLSPDAEPLRVLHLSDLHMVPGQRRKQQWIAALAATDPDLVVVTGDNMADEAAVPGVIRAMAPLLERPGAFVFGSNDYHGPIWASPLRYFDRDREYTQGVPLPYDELREVFTSAGWADVNNARTLVKAGGRTIEIVGVDDPHIGRDDYPAVAGPVDPAADVHLALTHSPEPRVLDRMAGDGFDLLLAGHTHGGQVCVPGVGALVTNCGLDRRMAKGLHRWPPAPPGSGPATARTGRGAVGGGRAGDGPVGGGRAGDGPVGGGRAGGGAAGGGLAAGGNSWLHVSAGLGTHPTAPIRFACPPEASLLTLVPR